MAQIMDSIHLARTIRTRFISFIAFVLTAILLVACNLGAKPMQTPAPTSTHAPPATAVLTPTGRPALPSTGRIVYVVFRGGSSEIYVMKSDGSGATNLTNNPAKDNYPTW
jgi:hypothetical protein